MTALTEEQQERLDIINHKLKFTEQRPTVAVIRSLDPIVLAADDMTKLINMAGGVLIEGDEQTLLSLNSDVLVLMPDETPIAQIMASIDQLLQLPGFTDLSAIKNNRLYIVDSETDNDDAAESTVETIEMLAEMIYPKQFIFGYEGTRWIKFTI